MLKGIEGARMFGISDCDSTNSLMKVFREKAATDIQSGFVLYTGYQRKGRGHGGSSWESEEWKNLIFSVYYEPADVPAQRAFVISEMVSLSVKATLDGYIPDVTVKWPNDIYYRDKKIAGILIENTVMEGRISESIIGIGININQMVFMSDAPNPVSLSQITGLTYETMDILHTFFRKFEVESARLRSNHFDEIHRDYLRSVYRKAGYHPYQDGNGIFEATIKDIEASGYLALERRDGVVSRYGFKEVSYL